MKIAQVCYKFPPYIGGVGTVVKEISERLVVGGFDVEVLTQDRSGTYPANEIINGVVVRRFRAGPLGWDFPFSRNSLKSYLVNNGAKYDLIHAHNYHDFAPLYAAQAKSTNKLVINPHYHGVGHNRVMDFLLKRYQRIGNITFDRADRILCVSETEKVIIKEHFNVADDKIVVVPNGVHCESIAKAEPFSFDGKGLLCVGRLERYKNIHLAVQAVPCLPKEYKLIIIGDGPYKVKLLQLIEDLLVTDRVQILSGLATEEVHRWYKTCHLVLNLSSIEAFGLTVLEGLAAGKPVVVNNKMALAELAARQKGVKPVDAEMISPSQLAKEIATIQDIGPEVPDLRDYTWDAIVERIQALYEVL